MSPRFLIPCMLLALWVPAKAEPEGGGEPHPRFRGHGWQMRPPKVWMGLRVSKPEESTAAQIPSLPEGIGFLVASIDKDGPAEAAGLRKLDIIWKLDDQMLVNESQMVTLLRLKSAGDEIKLAAFRAGQPFEVTLTLADAPAHKEKAPGDLMDAAMFPKECGWPMRVVNVADKTASYQRDEGRAEVRFKGDVYHVRITGPKDEVIHEGDVPKDGRINEVPKEWLRIVYALRRGLDHALEKGPEDPRQPRPRVVPPSENRP